MVRFCINTALPLAMAFGILLTGCEKKRESIPLIARVGNTTLTQIDIQEQLGITDSESINKDGLENYVYRWVDSEVIYQTAVTERIDRLPKIQVELERLRRDLIISYYVDSKLGNQPTVQENDLLTYYRQNKNDFARDFEEFRYSYLICRDEKIAQSVKAELRKGKKFEEIVAERYPNELFNRQWDSGFVRLEQAIQPLQKNIGRQSVGPLYGPVAAQGYHVVYQLVERYDAGSVRDLSLVRELIAQRLREGWYREGYQTLMAALKRNKNIDINLDALEEKSAAN